MDLLAANTLPTPRDLPSIHNMEHNFQVISAFIACSPALC